MATWKKLGLIFEPRGQHPKLLSHAANPLAVKMPGGTHRIYYSGRDAQNRSSVGYFEADLLRQALTYVHDRPVFEHGPEGSYYSHGVSIGNCYSVGEKTYMTFMGWEIPPDAHWRGQIGRLLVHPNAALSLADPMPLLGLDEFDPLSLSYPWVEADGQGAWHMWYGSTLAWDAGNGEMSHVIRYAHSRDAQHWSRLGLALPFELGRAQAFSRPSLVSRDEGGWQMWFSYRGAPGRGYRIGRAESLDGRLWQLQLHDPDIDVSGSGWDSEMIEYPFVFDHAGKRWMLYNGNGFGKSGIGLALLERDA